MAGHRKPGPENSHGPNGIDVGTTCRSRTRAPGLVGLRQHDANPAGRGLGGRTYSYAISGTPGNLMGGMFLTVAQERLPGTWYDYSDATNQLRGSEAQLGQSDYADDEFRKMARRIVGSLESPQSVDVEIHVAKQGGVETMQVLGPRGTRSYRFDFDQASNVKLPDGADVFQPFHDAIDQIIELVLQVR